MPRGGARPGAGRKRKLARREEEYVLNGIWKVFGGSPEKALEALHDAMMSSDGKVPELASRINAGGGVDPQTLQNFAMDRAFTDAGGRPERVWYPPDSEAALKSMLRPGVVPQRNAVDMGAPQFQSELGAGGVRAQMGASLPTSADVPMVKGNNSVLQTPTGERPFTYGVVEAPRLVISHDPVTFAKNADYPDGVQERAYHSSAEAQARVIHQTQNYQPAFTINTNPDAVNGPPIVTRDGVVLGGNSRAMSTARLYATNQGDVYKSALLNQAGQFGLDPGTIRDMKQPVLVRQLAEPLGTVDDARRMAAEGSLPRMVTDVLN